MILGHGAVAAFRKYISPHAWLLNDYFADSRREKNSKTAVTKRLFPTVQHAKNLHFFFNLSEDTVAEVDCAHVIMFYRIAIVRFEHVDDTILAIFLAGKVFET